jgi:hypothetical protein
MRSCCFVCLCRACLCERSSSKSKCWTETSSTLCIAQLRNSDFTSSSIYLYKSYMRLVMWWRGPLHSSLLSKMSQTASRSSSSEPHRSLFRYRLVSPTCIIGSRSSSGYIVASSCFLSRSAILSSTANLWSLVISVNSRALSPCFRLPLFVTVGFGFGRLLIAYSKAPTNHFNGNPPFRMNIAVGKRICMWDRMACAVSPHKSVYNLHSKDVISPSVCAGTVESGINSGKMCPVTSSESRKVAVWT